MKLLFKFFLVTIIATINFAQPANGLVAYYPLNENAYDESRNDVLSFESRHVFLADKKIEIERRLSSTSGDIHSNGRIKFKKGGQGRHIGNLTSIGKIEIKKDNFIIGNVKSGNKIKVGKNSVIIGTVTEFSNVSEIPLPTLSFTAGGEDITVEQNRRRFLVPGSYNKVNVKKNAKLHLATGKYFFNELKLNEKAVLTVNLVGPTVINIVKKLNFKKETEIKILRNRRSRFLTFNILDAKKIIFEKGSKILGSFIAPEAKVVMKKEVIFSGSISAKEIKVNKDTDFKFHSIPDSVDKGGNTTGAREEQHELPENFLLSQNYPNPFNPLTTISYSVPELSFVTLKVYDVLGNEIATLVNKENSVGSYTVEFDATTLPSGIFFYKLQAGDFVETKKMVLMK